MSTGLLAEAHAQPVLAAITASMLLAPLVIRHNERLADRILPRARAGADTDVAEIEAAVHGTREHVILCGYGRVGGQIAALLAADGIPFVAIDLHPARARDGWEDGQQVFYGDATHGNVLQALGIARAHALVVSFDDERAALRVTAAARRLAPEIPILVRSRDDSALERLLAAGASEVVPETLETSLTLALCLLSALGRPDYEVDRRIRAVRDDRYALIRDR
jgi:CPA2 family monovalent cation:H+ antiporter-2